jgi:hypothetical protein
MCRNTFIWSVPLVLVLGTGCSASNDISTIPELSGAGRAFVTGFGGAQVTAGYSGTAGMTSVVAGIGGTTVPMGGTSGKATGGKQAAGTGGASGKAGSSGSSGAKAGSGGAGGAGGVTAAAGSGACDTSAPPSNVSAWIDESWNREGKPNITNRSVWLSDSAMKGKGQINVCVRWGATSAMTTDVRDKLQSQMELWMNQWFSKVYPYDCFPYEKIVVKITGYAVRPGKESLMPSGTSPVYTDQESGSTPAGEPKCPDACGLFFNWDHKFPSCAGGEEAHFDYSLWLDDALPGGGGAAAVGGDWGLRMPVADFIRSLGVTANDTVLHEMGHGFGLSDYYTWTGSRPEGGSILIVGSSRTGLPTEGDKWLVRRYWKETKTLRYP